MAWAIGRERADLICEHLMSERPAAAGGGSCLLAVARFARLGTLVDGGAGPGGEAAQCHPDAEAAYMAAAAALAAPELRLVVHFARAGCPPDWAPFKVVTAERERVWRDGKWKTRIRRPGGGPAFCKVTWRDRGPELGAWRERYLAWHAALTRVEVALAGVALRKYRVVPLRAPERPWEASPAPPATTLARTRAGSVGGESEAVRRTGPDRALRPGSGRGT